MPSQDTQNDSFEPIHKKYKVKESGLKFTKIPKFDNVSYSAEDSCNKKLVGKYASILYQMNGDDNASNLKVVIYPGTICEINGHDRVFAVIGRNVFVPGMVCKDYNESGFIDVVATANFLRCLMSVNDIESGKTFVSHNDVIRKAKKLVGEKAAEEIKIYYEITL